MLRVFDGHSDLFEDVYEKRNRGMRDVIKQIHAPKWEKGYCKSGFCPIWADPFSEVYPLSVDEQYEGITAQMEAELLNNPCAEAVTCSSEYLEAINAGRHAIILGAEGLSWLHGDYGRIEELYGRKFRIFSLTWNEDNDFAEGAGGSCVSGLSENGRQAVRKIEKLGAVLDLAHSGRKTFFDAVKLAQQPFVVSHGNIDALRSHPRNFTDEQLRIIRDFDGVMGISAYPPFISEKKDGQTLRTFCDNVKYAADLIGVEHVGLGFDFVDFLDDFGTDESLGGSLKGLEGIHQAQNIYSELKKDGFSEDELEKIFSGNFERIIKEILH